MKESGCTLFDGSVLLGSSVTVPTDKLPARTDTSCPHRVLGVRWELIPAAHSIVRRFAVATPEELAVNNDDCAICWDSMQAARKLPCGHLFHK